MRRGGGDQRRMRIARRVARHGLQQARRLLMPSQHVRVVEEGGVAELTLKVSGQVLV